MPKSIKTYVLLTACLLLAGCGDRSFRTFGSSSRDAWQRVKEINEQAEAERLRKAMIPGRHVVIDATGWRGKVIHRLISGDGVCVQYKDDDGQLQDGLFDYDELYLDRPYRQMDAKDAP